MFNRHMVNRIVPAIGLLVLVGCGGTPQTATNEVTQVAEPVAAGATVMADVTAQAPAADTTETSTTRETVTAAVETTIAAETDTAIGATTVPKPTVTVAPTPVITVSTEVSTAEDYVRRGNAKTKAKDHDGALADYGEAIKLNDELPGAYMNRSTLSIKLDYPKAIADLDKVIELRPKNYTAHFYRGVSYQLLKDYNNAIISFDNAITIKDDFLDAYISRAESKAGQKDYDAAFADFERAIKLDEANAAPLLARGVVYANRDTAGDKDKAIADFRKGLELAKNDAQRKRARNQLKKLGVDA